MVAQRKDGSAGCGVIGGRRLRKPGQAEPRRAKHIVFHIERFAVVAEAVPPLVEEPRHILAHGVAPLLRPIQLVSGSTFQSRNLFGIEVAGPQRLRGVSLRQFYVRRVLQAETHARVHHAHRDGVLSDFEVADRRDIVELALEQFPESRDPDQRRADHVIRIERLQLVDRAPRRIVGQKQPAGKLGQLGAVRMSPNGHEDRSARRRRRSQATWREAT